MMEFTYNGLVRYGFGFYNPNHAAALFCFIMPFFWGWKRLTWLGYLLSALLLIPLSMTFSRTGLLVLVLEFFAFYFLSGRKNLKLLLAGIAVLILCAGIWGVFSRFTLDKAVTNRPQIWLAGLKIYAANPWGVGLGNSGLIVSTFLLDGIVCRTLVNSHLTLLAEGGILIGFIWPGLIFYALLNGIRKPAVWCAFAGLTLSAFCASVFDWPVLFDFRTFGELGMTNFLLSWVLLLSYLGALFYLAWGKINRKRLLIALNASLLIVLFPFVFYSGKTPVVCDGMVRKSGREMPLVLYDDEWNPRSVLPYLKDGYFLPLRSGKIKRTQAVKTVWFFGQAAEYAPDYPDAEKTFVSPPEFFELLAGAKRIE
ncbi:MAG: hypothetical protein IKO93_08670 [Lentisphaeria bacterium]|nr:hypothetical protein [Lentisphaeria bacterium]